MQEDNIEYSGRPGEYRPEIGSGVNSPTATTGIETNHYADLDYLQNQLLIILRESRALILEAEELLTARAIAVGTDDERLYEANNLEWPSSLGDPRNKISYRYYKALRVRDTTSAFYIRKRYEEAARDVAGHNAIDVISLAEIIYDEAQLVQGFLNEYVGNVDDAAEYRTLELFQDWTVSAIEHTRKLRGIFEAGDTSRTLNSAGLGVSTAAEAKQSQAVFKIKLNASNDTIVRDLDYVRKYFSESAAVFYTKFLGPALQVRLDVGRKTFPLGSQVAAEVDRAASSLDSNLESLLADQQRRNRIFNSKLEKLTEDIAQRDEYRGFIHQLAPVGKAIPTTGAGVMVDIQDAEEEIQYFDSVEPALGSSIFASPHAALGDLDADDHPQYLKKTGGVLTGHLSLADNVLIDGMRPGLHQHTGQDGTEQIHAGDLLPGSLRTGSIDTSEVPAKPTQLRVISQDIEIVPPGVAQLNAIIQWVGTRPDDLYEVEYVPVGGGGEIKIVSNEPAPFIPPTYTTAALDPENFNPMYPVAGVVSQDHIVEPESDIFFQPPESQDEHPRTIWALNGTRYVAAFRSVGIWIHLLDLDADGGDVTRPASPVLVSNTGYGTAQVVILSATTGAIAYHTWDGTNSAVRVRTFSVTGDTISLGSEYTIASAADQTYIPYAWTNYGGNITLQWALTLNKLDNGNFFVSTVSAQFPSPFKTYMWVVNLNVATWSTAASVVLQSGSPGFASSHPALFIDSAYSLSSTEILISGLNDTMYVTQADPVFGGMNVSPTKLGASFVAVVTISGANLSIGSYQYPVTPIDAEVFNNQATIPSSYATSNRRRVIRTFLMPAGTGYYILMRQYAFQISSTTYQGIEFRAVGVSGTTVSVSSAVIGSGFSADILNAKIVPAPNTDGYIVFFSITGTSYVYWFDMTKVATPYLTPHVSNIYPQFIHTGQEMTPSLVSPNEIAIMGQVNTANRYVGALIDLTTPFYSFVNEDKGPRLNVAVKEGVSIMAWAEGLSEQLTYRPVVVDSNHNVSFKTAVKFPNPAPEDKYWTGGYGFGHIAKLDEGKFVTATEEWVAIGTLNSSNELSFGASVATPEVGKDLGYTSWNGSPQRVTLFSLSPTKFILLYASYSGAYNIDNQAEAEDMTLFGYVGTVNGTAITWGPRQDLTNSIGWESYGYWDYVPSSYQIQGAVVAENTILLALHLADYSDPTNVYGVNSIVKLVVTDNTIAFSVEETLPDVAQLFNPIEDLNTGIDLYAGYEMERVEDGKALFVFVEQYNHPEGYGRLFAQIITLDDDIVVLHDRYALTDEGDPDEYNYHINAQTTVLGYGKWAVMRVTPQGFGGELDDRDPRVIAIKIDGSTITKEYTAQFSDREQHPGEISAPREDTAFLWIMDWTNEFGSTDRALAKIVTLD